MDDAPFVPVGRVVKVHGVKGEVSVAMAAGPPFSLPEGIPLWVVPPAGKPVPRVVERVRQGPKGPLVKLAGIDDRHGAEDLRDRTLVARPSDLPADYPDEPADETGMAVYDADRGFLGEVVDTIVTGANDVWVIDGGPFGEVLVPVIDDVVVEIDEERGRIDVTLLPGLIEEEPRG